ncbi:MFS transporter [Brevibacterium sp. Re57]|uniref:MFS transporter n=1 Tax=Brevibacterium gallinarum TaxID=2762220 RepID=A0ABR8WX96_9MICO|nr:MFS transporter [Brevibacterium gallinarum]MBD8021603.1 MFS transporter [Brevibacterium gallinarum]
MSVEANLKAPAFRQLWGANLFTNVAALFFTFSANVIMVNVLHASAFAVGLLDAVTYTGTLLFGFVVGTWIDRWGHKRVLVVSTILRGCALAFIPIAYFAGILTPWRIIVLGVAVSICDVFFQTAHTSVLPSIVGRDHV